MKFELQAQTRGDMGKGASRRLRRLDNAIPAVVYGSNKPAQSITIAHNVIFHALEHEAFYSSVIDLNVDGTVTPVILKDLQRHPYKPKIVHADFLRVDMNKEIHVHVPLHFVGTAAGVKQGGIVSHLMIEVEVVCLPKSLPEFIEVDVTAMQLNDILHLSQVKLPKGVKANALEHGEDPALVSIHMPRVVEETTEAPAAEEGETPAAEAPSAE